MPSQTVVVALVLALVVAATVVVADSNGFDPASAASAEVESVQVDSARSTGTATDSRSVGPARGALRSQTAPTPIDSCRVIDQPGEYVLTQDLVSDPATTPPGFVCLLVTVDGSGSEVVIDGAGFELRSSGRSDTAISISREGTTVVTDLALTGWGQAVEADENQRVRGFVGSVELSNVAARDNGVVVQTDSARRVVVEDSEFSGNGAGLSTEETTVELRRLTVTDSEFSGIAGSQTSGIIEDSEFSNNARDGIQMAISGSFEFRNVVARDNGQSGVTLAETDRVTLVDSDLTGNGEAGLRMNGVSDSEISSNYIADNEIGVWLDSNLGGTTLTRNRIENNADVGMLVEQIFFGGSVYDNAFSNDANVRLAPLPPFTDAPLLTWSVDPRAELNVAEGAFVGGNYYASPDGDGFSQTCVDTDVDTLCDDPFELFEENVDEHPLAEPFVPADEPPTSVAPADLRGVTFAVDCGVLTGGRSLEFGYGPLGDAGIPPDAASQEWTNEEVLDVVFESPLGPAVKLLGLDPDDLLWTANPDEQVVRVFADTRLGVRSCTCTVVD